METIAAQMTKRLSIFLIENQLADLRAVFSSAVLIEGEIVRGVPYFSGAVLQIIRFDLKEIEKER